MKNLPKGWLQPLLIFSLIFIIAMQIASRVFFASFDYDEGYNLQIPLHIHANFLSYATYDSSFDPFISTGPTVLFPAAMFVFQKNPVLPRMIMLIYSLLFIFLVLKSVYTTFSQKVIFLLLLLVLPLFYFYSSHILGELPGLFFVFSSLIFASKKKYLYAGICFSLSILTKSINLLASIPLLYVFFASQNFSLFYAKRWKNVSRWFCGIILPFFLWCIYMFFSLHMDLGRWVDKLYVFESVARELSLPKPELFFLRVSMFGYVFYVNGFLFLLFALLVSFTLLFSKKNSSTLVKGISIYTILFLLQFLFLGNTIWYRQIFPAVLALFTLLPLFFTLFVFQNKHYVILLVSLFILSTVIYRRFEEPKDLLSVKLLEQKFTFYHEGYFPFISPDQLLISQIKTASFISHYVPNTEHLSGTGWWNSPEISYLARRKIYRNSLDSTSRFLISGVYGKLLNPVGDKTITNARNTKNVFMVSGYAIYKKTE